MNVDSWLFEIENAMIKKRTASLFMRNSCPKFSTALVNEMKLPIIIQFYII